MNRFIRPGESLLDGVDIDAIHRQQQRPDYADHMCALDGVLKELRASLRDKRYGDADRLTAAAMSKLARVHGWIGAQTRKGST